MSKYIIKNGKLFIITTAGEKEWIGKWSHANVKKVIDFPREMKAIVLFEYDNWTNSDGLNLICIDMSGKILWQASDATGQLSGDSIVDISLDGSTLLANTWFGKRAVVDYSRGSIECTGFTK